jgi:hypothetical protein
MAKGMIKSPITNAKAVVATGFAADAYSGEQAK